MLEADAVDGGGGSQGSEEGFGGDDDLIAEGAAAAMRATLTGAADELDGTGAAGGGFHEQRLVHATQTDDADKGPAVGGGTCNLPRDEGGRGGIAGVSLHAIAAGHCKGALAGDGHSALILGKSGFYGAEQFLVGGVGGGKAAGGAGRGAGSATDALLRGDNNALIAQGDGTRGAHGGAAQAFPVAVAHEHAALGLDRKQR